MSFLRNPDTLHHVLNNCPTFLEQGRYTWRHDSVLSQIVSSIKDAYSCSPCIQPEVFSDLNNQQFQLSSTIPIDVLPTAQIPDIVILWRDTKKIDLVELTISFETNLESTEIRKTNKYAALVSDLQAEGYSTSFVHLSVGSRGLITAHNSRNLQSVHPLSWSRKNLKELKSKIMKTSIAASYGIYCRRKDPAWQRPELLLN